MTTPSLQRVGGPIQGGFVPRAPTYTIQVATSGPDVQIEQLSRVEMTEQVHPADDTHTEHTVTVTPLRTQAFGGIMRVVNEPAKKMSEVRRVTWTTDANGKRLSMEADEDVSPLLKMVDTLLPTETLQSFSEDETHVEADIDIGSKKYPLIVHQVLDRTVTYGEERWIDGRAERAFSVDVSMSLLGPKTTSRRMALLVRAVADGWFVPETKEVESVTAHIRTTESRKVQEQVIVRQRCRSNCP